METEPLLAMMRDGEAVIVIIRPTRKNWFTQADRRNSVFNGR